MSRDFNKPEKLVLDTNVYLNYLRFDKLYRLINAIVSYELEVFVCDELLFEIDANLDKVSIQSLTQTEKLTILELIKSTTFYSPITRVFNTSPDPKNNFLFDLAIQTKSEVIVTKETKLLLFETSPIKVHDIKWFKENFPVAL